MDNKPHKSATAIGIIISLTLTPLLLGLHWWTGHTAWVFLFGVFAVFYTLVGAVGIVAAIIALSNDKPTPVPPTHWWRWVSGIIMQVGALTYLLWSESFIVASLYIIQASTIWILFGLLRMLRKRNAEVKVVEPADPFERRRAGDR